MSCSGCSDCKGVLFHSVPLDAAKGRGVCPVCGGHGGDKAPEGHEDSKCEGVCPECWCPGCHDGQDFPQERIGELDDQEPSGSWLAFELIHGADPDHARFRPVPPVPPSATREIVAAATPTQPDQLPVPEEAAEIPNCSACGCRHYPWRPHHTWDQPPQPPVDEKPECERCGDDRRVVVEPEPGFDTKEPEWEPCPDCTGPCKDGLDCIGCERCTLPEPDCSTSEQEGEGWPAELHVAIEGEMVAEITWGDEVPPPGSRRYIPADAEGELLAHFHDERTRLIRALRKLQKGPDTLTPDGLKIVNEALEGGR